MLCGSAGCGCAFESSTLNISIGPEGQFIIEQAEFTSITTLQADVASLQASRTTDEANIATLQGQMATATAANTRFDSMAAGTVLQAGAGVGPTSGTTQLTIVTASLGPFGYNGTLVWGGHALYTKTVITDQFSVYATLNAANRARGAGRSQIAGEWGAASTAVAVLAADTPVISIGLVRDAGTGTATTVASTNAGGLWWNFVPS